MKRGKDSDICCYIRVSVCWLVCQFLSLPPNRTKNDGHLKFATDTPVTIFKNSYFFEKLTERVAYLKKHVDSRIISSIAVFK